MSERIQGVTQKEYKGVMYKSILEADTAEALDCMGIPIRYEERTFCIFDGFKCPFQKRKVMDTHYKPDFWVGDIILECKGYETPEWKLKKKLIFKYLMENEPEVIFYQINKHSWRKDLIQALDNHWSYLGYAIQVTSRDSKRKPSETRVYGSIREAMSDLQMHKNITPILKSLTGEREWVYNYKWQIVNISL